MQLGGDSEDDMMSAWRMKAIEDMALSGWKLNGVLDEFEE